MRLADQAIPAYANALNLTPAAPVIVHRLSVNLLHCGIVCHLLIIHDNRMKEMSCRQGRTICFFYPKKLEVHGWDSKIQNYEVRERIRSLNELIDALLCLQH